MTVRSLPTGVPQRAGRWRTTAALAGAAIITAAGLTAVAAPALAAPATCPASPLDGAWHNMDPDTTSITRINVTVSCGDDGTNSYSVAVWSKCDTGECAWAVVPATLDETGWINAVYTYDTYTSYLSLITGTDTNGTYLEAWDYDDYPDDSGHADVQTDDWLVK